MEHQASTEDSFYVVGIGASAGGLEALEQFFGKVPIDSGMAYVVVQHLSPDFDSLMDQLLARVTELPVIVIEDDTQIRPNNIYLLPPRKEVITISGRLMLADRGRSNQPSFPIDRFFRSLAQDFGEHSIAVVLSGTGSDGARGIVDVHAVGGLVTSQSDKSAQFDGMPRSACSTGVVDMALSADELPSALIRHTKLKGKALPIDQVAENGDKAPFFRIINRLDEAHGLDFSNYKLTTISRRIERRLVMSDQTDLEAYADLVCNNDVELQQLYFDLLIGVTGFFRDQEVFDQIESEVIPRIVGRLNPTEELRCWVAACASGEEAYSLAISISEYLAARNDSRSVRIFASDVHGPALDTASQGIYQSDSLSGVSEERLERFFIKRNTGYQICPEIRKMVVFTKHNLLINPPFMKMDFVTCRNMMIYLTTQAKRKAISLLHFGLKPDGVLCIGMSESLESMADEFKAIDAQHRIFEKSRDVPLNNVRDALYPKVKPGALEPRTTKREIGSRKARERQLFSAYDQLLQRFMPAGILINGDGELVHSFEATGFLQFRDGRATSNALEMLIPELKSPASVAVRRARREKQPVSVDFVDCPTLGDHQQVKILAWLLDGEDLDNHVMVQFEVGKCATTGDATQELRQETPQQINVSYIPTDEINVLERELQATRDELHATIADAQSTNEDLQSANEELTTANEELQSTNEELHSVNEELYTVNAEHQRKIDELTDLNDDMDNLLASTNVHTIFLDRDLRIRRFTPGIAATFNLIPQDIGRRFDSFTHNIEHDSLMSQTAQVAITEQPHQEEVFDADGNWFLLKIMPYISRGSVDGVVVTLVDITTLKDAQSELREMSEIVEHSDDAIYRVDLEGEIRTWNLGATKLYGYSGNEVIGKNVLMLAPEGRTAEPSIYLGRTKAGFPVDRVETERKRRNGTIVQVSLTVSPIRDPHGAIVGASIISRDITKEKLAEQEIRQAVQQRDQFLATLSHELRNPLAAIINAKSLLDQESLDPETSADARDVVDHQLRHVARLLDDLLDVARYTNGKLMIRREVVDLSALVMNVVECVQHQIDDRGQFLHVNVPDGPVYVEGDVGRLQQAQVNLLVNASKYSGKGDSIWYSIDQSVGEVSIKIRDEGEGIAPHLLPTIFEPFVQAEQSLERSEGGMGLGLPLVKIIADSHEGTVQAISNGAGTGSEFELRIPSTDREIAEESTPAIVVNKESRLLLIEDNDGIRRMLARSMELKGLSVETATNGRDGILAIEGFHPDCAIVDIGLPDINGYQLAKNIRSRAEFNDVRLIAVTGYGRDEDRRRALDAGFDVTVHESVR